MIAKTIKYRIYLSGSLLFIILILTCASDAKAATISASEPVWRVLKEDPIGVAKIWRFILDSVNYFVIALLIFVAFAQILRLNVNTYGIKKVLPSLIFAVVAANFSYLIIRLLLDFANIITSYFIHPNIEELSKQFDMVTQSGTGDKLADENPIASLLYILLTLIGTVMVYILAYLLYIRNFIIYFLVPLAPLAFMSTILPQTKSVFNQWWSNFLKWTFMPVVSAFWLWLGSIWGIKIGDTGTAEFMKFAFALACFYLAMTTPFKMGGAIMTKWGGLGQKAWKATGGAAIGAVRKSVVDAKIDEYKNRAKTWYLHQANKGEDTFLGNTIGRYVRRSYRVKDYRADMKKAVEGAENSAYREALGGKDKLDGSNESRFLSRKKQIEVAKRKSDIASDFGEQEWINKHIDALYRQTPAGEEATARSSAYQWRMEADENTIKKISADIESAFNLEKKGEYNKYTDNKTYGKEWSTMYEKAFMTRSHLDQMDRSKKKSQGDAESENDLNSGKLEMWKYGFDQANRQLAGIAEKLEPLVELERLGQLTEDQITELAKLRTDQDKLNQAKVELSQNWRLLLDQIIEKYYDKDRKRFTSQAASIQSLLTDRNGNFSTERSIEEATSSLEGLPPEVRDLAITRIGKRYSERFKEERQSTVGKREPLEAGQTVFKWFKSKEHRDQVIKFMNGAADRADIDPVFERKIDAEISRAIGDASGETLVQTMNMFTDMRAEAARGGHTGSRHSLVDQATAIGQYGANDALRKEIGLQLQKEGKISEEDKRKRTEELQAELMKENSEVRRDMEKRLRERYRTLFALDQDQVDMLDISFNEEGMPTVNLKKDVRKDLIEKQIHATEQIIKRSGSANVRDQDMSLFRQGFAFSRDLVSPRKKEPHTVNEEYLKSLGVNMP